MTTYSDSLITNIATTKTNIATTGTDIDRLNIIPKPSHSAMQLHQQRNAMLNRAQRIEDRRHCQWVQNQKSVSAAKLVAFKDKLSVYEAQLADYEKTLIDSKDLTVLQPMAPVLAEPMTSPLLFPRKVQTRQNTKRRLGQSRYGY